MDSSTLLLIQLFLAHLLGDFLLQSDAINAGKCGLNKTKTKEITIVKQYIYLFEHSFIHALLAFFIVGELDYWAIPIIIFITHLAIDTVKSNSKAPNSSSAFLIDQLTHFIVIISIVYYYREPYGNIFQTLVNEEVYNKGIILFTGFLLIGKPASILLKLSLKHLIPHYENTNSGIEQAGMWIGYLERFLILTFILLNQFAAVGFLLTAKSIFRFGELTKANDLQKTEYVLIGTLASFTIAIAVSITTQFMLDL